MPSVVLKDIKIRKKEKIVIREFSFTDVEVQECFGDDRHIEEKVRLALRRTEQGSLECTSC
jgi:hypothetical protein